MSNSLQLYKVSVLTDTRTNPRCPFNPKQPPSFMEEYVVAPDARRAAQSKRLWGKVIGDVELISDHITVYGSYHWADR